MTSLPDINPDIPLGDAFVSPDDMKNDGAPDLSIVIPVNAKADLLTVKPILHDLSSYSGSNRFEVVLMLNNYAEQPVPDEIKEWESCCGHAQRA